MDLEGKLESLREYICFLTRLYEEVRTCDGQGEMAGGTGSLWPWGEPLGGKSPRIAFVCGHSSFDHQLLSTSVRFTNE